MSRKVTLFDRMVSTLLICAMIVTFMAPTALAFYASGLSRNNSDVEYICGFEPHEHDESCYEAYDSGLVCREEFERLGLFWRNEETHETRQYIVHEHDDSCYDEYGLLTCYLDEIERHVHDINCYEYIGVESGGESGDEFDDGEFGGSSDGGFDDESSEDSWSGSDFGDNFGDNSGISSEDDFESDFDELDLPLALDYDYSIDPDYELICSLPDMSEWEAHRHNGDCFAQERVLVCNLEEHVHDDSCVKQDDEIPDESEPPVFVSDSVVYAFVVSAEHFSRDVNDGVYFDDDAAFRLVLASLEQERDRLLAENLTEVQRIQINYAIGLVSSACDVYFEYLDSANKPDVEPEPDFDIDGFIVLLNRFFDRLAVGYYHEDFTNFEVDVVEVNAWRAEWDAVNHDAFDAAQVDMIYALLADYDSERVAFDAYMTAYIEAENALVAYVDYIDNMIQAASDGAYDEDLAAFWAACTEADALALKLERYELSEEQQARFDEATAKYQALRDVMSENVMTVVGCSFVPQVVNHVVAGTAVNAGIFVFSVEPQDSSQLGTCFTMSGNTCVMNNSSATSSVGNFPSIYFKEEGTYLFDIKCIQAPESYKRDDRVWTMSVVVELFENPDAEGVFGLNCTSSCKLSGVTSTVQKLTVDSAEFINVYASGFSYSADTMQKARAIMSDMSDEEKAGQLILSHWSNNWKRDLDEYHVGGFILFSWDVQNDTVSSLQTKIATAQESSAYPLMISVDEEGGKVNRVSLYTQFRSKPFSSSQDLYAQGGFGAISTSETEKAQLLSNLGFNMNHAPVADVATGGFIFPRTFGQDGVGNAQYVRTAVSVLESNGMGSTMKHFPGYGSTSSDTHNGFAINDLSLDDFKYSELLPFYSGIAAGGQAVMVTHNIINCLDSENPASLSPAVYSLLRDELGFYGLAITDDLNMGAVISAVGKGNQSLNAILAGADVALAPYPDVQVPPVLEAIRNGTLSMERVEESCLRVLCWKIEHGLFDDWHIEDDGEVGEIVENPIYDVQYYANLPRLAYDDSSLVQYVGSTSYTNELPVIDTTGGKMPRNGGGLTASPNENAIRSLYVDINTGLLVTKSTLLPLYSASSFDYNTQPDLSYLAYWLSIHDLSAYELAELWVLKPGKDSTSVVRRDWDIYDLHGLRDYGQVEFVNDPELVTDERTIFIRNNAVLRIVFDEASCTEEYAASFYDYDISTGFIYNSRWEAKSNTNPRATSSQRDSDYLFMYTGFSGINSAENYKGSGAKFAFGNANTGSGLQHEMFNGNLFNKGNATHGNQPAVPGSYKSCTFGLVSGISDGKLVYSDGIDAPNLFNDGPAVGKTSYDNNEYSLNFHRVGDVHTLLAVNGTDVRNLDVFVHPSPYDGLVHNHIWTNNFWPMDAAPSFGADGHDMKFGGYANNNNRNFAGVAGSGGGTYDAGWLPTSDDGLNHNSFFGMNFSVGFSLTDDYVGPLEYYFFGDDDLWVFLDGRLVCDVGGVHSSVGIYADLWDYLKQGEAGEHTLSVFYTERGSSGSTCYMGFALPNTKSLVQTPTSGALRIDKECNVIDADETEFLFEVVLTDASGAALTMPYRWIRYDENDVRLESGITQDGLAFFPLKQGDYVLISGLPIGAKYTVRELDPGTRWTPEQDEISGDIGPGTNTVEYLNLHVDKLVLPSTGSDGIMLTAFAGSSFLIIAIALWLGRMRLKKRASDNMDE